MYWLGGLFIICLLIEKHPPPFALHMLHLLGYADIRNQHSGYLLTQNTLHQEGFFVRDCRSKFGKHVVK